MNVDKKRFQNLIDILITRSLDLSCKIIKIEPYNTAEELPKNYNRTYKETLNNCKAFPNRLI